MDVYIYRSPRGDKDCTISTTAEICNILTCAIARKVTHLLIAGDFNLSGIDWENDCVQNNQEYLIQFVNTIHDCFLFQHFKKPTRYREGETPNIFDLVLTNEEGMIDTIDHCSGLGKSDHECLIFELKCYKETCEKTSLTRDNFKGDYEKIANTLDDNDRSTILQGEISVSYDNLVFWNKQLQTMYR